MQNQSPLQNQSLHSRYLSNPEQQDQEKQKKSIPPYKIKRYLSKADEERAEKQKLIEEKKAKRKAEKEAKEAEKKQLEEEAAKERAEMMSRAEARSARFQPVKTESDMEREKEEEERLEAKKKKSLEKIAAKKARNEERAARRKALEEKKGGEEGGYSRSSQTYEMDRQTYCVRWCVKLLISSSALQNSNIGVFGSIGYDVFLVCNLAWELGYLRVESKFFSLKNIFQKTKVKPMRKERMLRKKTKTKKKKKTKTADLRNAEKAHQPPGRSQPQLKGRSPPQKGGKPHQSNGRNPPRKEENQTRIRARMTEMVLEMRKKEIKVLQKDDRVVLLNGSCQGVSVMQTGSRRAVFRRRGSLHRQGVIRAKMREKKMGKMEMRRRIRMKFQVMNRKRIVLILKLSRDGKRKLKRKGMLVVNGTTVEGRRIIEGEEREVGKEPGKEGIKEEISKEEIKEEGISKEETKAEIRVVGIKDGTIKAATEEEIKEEIAAQTTTILEIGATGVMTIRIGEAIIRGIIRGIISRIGAAIITT